MAYQADILINVRGFRDLDRIQKALEGTIHKINEVNKAAARMGEPVRNLERFTKQVQLAEKALQLAAIGSKQEQRAVNNYVTALQNSNTARTHQNKLINAEIAKRNAVVNAIRKSVEANVADSRAMRQARAEASALNKELADQERLRRKLAERGLMQLKGGAIAKGTEAGFGVQGPKLPSGAMNLPAGVSRLTKPATGLQAPGVMDAILGGAFPALFGAGPGAMAGGAIGGLVGGKMGGIGGMALSVAFSAVGQQIDAAIKKVQDLGNAIQLVDVDKLRESFVFVNAELEVAITRSIRLGDIEGARAMAAAAAAQQTGAMGTAVRDSANATNMLADTWRKVSGSVSTLLSMLAAPFAAALAGILEVVNLVAVGWNKIISLVGTGIKGVGEFVVRLFGGQKAVDYIEQGFKNLNSEQNKANAAAQLKLETLHEEGIISSALLRLEKQRTAGVTAGQKLENIGLDLKKEKLTLTQDLWRTEAAINEEFKNSAPEVREDLINRVRLTHKEKLDHAELLSNRQKEAVILQDALDTIKASQTAALAGLDRRQAISEQVLRIEQSFNDLQQSGLTIQEQRYQVQLKYAKSLNEVSALIDASMATQLAQAELHRKVTYEQADASVRAADFEAQRAAVRAKAAQDDMRTLDIANQLTELKRVELQATIDQEAVAQAAVSAAAQMAVNTKTAADQTYKHSQFLLNVERSEKQVAAYAAEYARQTEAATRSLKAQEQAVQNRLSITQALVATAQTINNIEIDSLRTKLQQTDSEQTRVGILNEISNLEIKNAELTYKATIAQIQAEVERQRIAKDIALVKLKELEAVVNIASAQGVVTQAHIAALQAQRDAYSIANGVLETTVKVAEQQIRVADAVYEASVSAANLRVQTEGAAAAAGSYAGSMERAASSMSAAGVANGTAAFGAAGRNIVFMAEYRKAMDYYNKKLGMSDINGKKYYEIFNRFLARAEEYNKAKATEALSAAREDWDKYTRTRASAIGPSMQGYASGGYVTRPQVAMIGEGGESEYVIPQSRMSAAMANYAAGKRGSQVLNPQVNITTGPVTQMDGTNYVTMKDLQQASSTAAKQGAAMALQTIRNNPAVRYNMGV